MPTAPGPVAIRLRSANREDRTVPFFRRLISILSRKQPVKMSAFGAFGKVRGGPFYRRGLENRRVNTVLKLPFRFQRLGLG